MTSGWRGIGQSRESISNASQVAGYSQKEGSNIRLPTKTLTSYIWLGHLIRHRSEEEGRWGEKDTRDWAKYDSKDSFMEVLASSCRNVLAWAWEGFEQTELAESFPRVRASHACKRPALLCIKARRKRRVYRLDYLKTSLSRNLKCSRKYLWFMSLKEKSSCIHPMLVQNSF